jgi:hypothetical protein
MHTCHMYGYNHDYMHTRMNTHNFLHTCNRTTQNKPHVYRCTQTHPHTMHVYWGNKVAGCVCVCVWLCMCVRVCVWCVVCVYWGSLVAGRDVQRGHDFGTSRRKQWGGGAQVWLVSSCLPPRDGCAHVPRSVEKESTDWRGEKDAEQMPAWLRMFSHRIRASSLRLCENIFCLLIDNVRARGNTYIWVSVQWVTKTSLWEIS